MGPSIKEGVSWPEFSTAAHQNFWETDRQVEHQKNERFKPMLSAVE